MATKKPTSKKTTGKRVSKKLSPLAKQVPTLAEVERYVKAGGTIGQLCAEYQISRVTFYKRLGAAVLGIAPRGTRTRTRTSK